MGSSEPQGSHGTTARSIVERDVVIEPSLTNGILSMPAAPFALILFAHGSGSGRFSPRNQAVARALNRLGLATLLIDLLTPEEEQDRANVFDITLLSDRLVTAVRWIDSQAELSGMPIGLFGASTGAAAALVAAARLGNRIGAVVSRGGRPDLAGPALPTVMAPTLLIVGGLDFEVMKLNETAFNRLTAPKEIEVVPDATHLFPEPGALDAVIELAARWFTAHLGARQSSGTGS